MTQEFGDILVCHPTEEALTAARAALRRQQDEEHYTCGCFVALCRNPLYAALERHWRAYHPSSLAILWEAQAACLTRFAEAARGLSTIPEVR